MLKNQKFAANANTFGKVAEEVNGRAAADGRKNTITYSQDRHKFKKLVRECNSA